MNTITSFIYIICIQFICVDTVFINESLLYNMVYDNMYAFAVSTSRFDATGAYGFAAVEVNTIGEIYRITNEEQIIDINKVDKKYPCFLFIDFKMPSWSQMYDMMRSKKVIAVIFSDLTFFNGSTYQVSYSSDQFYPNKRSSLYHPNQQPGFNYLARYNLSSFLPIPLIQLTCNKETQRLRDLINHDPNVKVTMQLEGISQGSLNTRRCIERHPGIFSLFNSLTEYCVPIGGKNLFMFLDFPLLKETPTFKDDSLIILLTRVDAMTDFPKLSPGVFTSVTNIVSLLLVAKAFGDNYKKNLKPKKNILFAFFNGESFENVGSSRLVYDILNGKFPNPQYLNPLTMKNIDLMLEISHISKKNLYIHHHSKGLSSRAYDKMNKNNIDLMSHNTDNKINLNILDSRQLPPNSMTKFLQVRKDIPNMLISDYETKYQHSNLYNSHMDELRMDPNTSFAELSQHINAISKVIFEYTYDRAFSRKATYSNSQEYADELLKCFVNDTNCDIFKGIQNGKYNLFFGNKRWNSQTDVSGEIIENVDMIGQFMAYYHGTKYNNITSRAACKQADENLLYEYYWMDGINETAHCVRSHTNLSRMISPAFDIKDHDFLTNKYSTWSESTHTQYNMRFFVVDNIMIQIFSVVLGVSISLLTFAFGYIINLHASNIFSVTECSSKPSGLSKTVNE